MFKNCPAFKSHPGTEGNWKLDALYHHRKTNSLGTVSSVDKQRSQTSALTKAYYLPPEGGLVLITYSVITKEDE